MHHLGLQQHSLSGDCRAATKTISPILHHHQGLLERPKFDQSSSGGYDSTESGYGAHSTDGSRRMGGGDYRVLGG